MVWGAFPIAAFFLTFVGGCKTRPRRDQIFRFEVLAIAIRVHAWRLIAPHSSRLHAAAPTDQQLFTSVLLFAGAYVGTVAVAALLSALGSIW
jgi:hypothetical protein